MPYPVQILDAESPAYINAYISTGWALTVGSSYQAGDMRVCFIFLSPTTLTLPTPSGWTLAYSANAPSGSGFKTWCFTRKLTDSESDVPLAPSVAAVGFYQAWTVRNPNIAQSISPTTSYVQVTGSDPLVTQMVWPSVTVTANSMLMMFGFTESAGADETIGTILTPPSTTQLALSQMTSSGYQVETPIYARGYTTAGSSGTNKADVFYSPGTPQSPYAAGVAYLTFCVVHQQNPDVQPTMTTSPNETDAGVVVTPSIPNTQTNYVMSTSPNEVDSAPQLFSQLTGYRISPPLAIPQSPITNSVVHWDQATFADGSTVTVETSVDGGLTWQLAANDQPIPRLLPGTSVWQTVQTRVTLKRLHVTDPTPRVSNLEVRVATNASEGELVSLGLFSINNTNITITGGTSGGSSGSGGGGNGVTGSGGGATGGGLSIEISGVDLSRSVSRNAWEDVYFVPAGTNYATAIHDIIEDRLPGTQYNFASTTHTTPKLIFGMSMDSDPWQDASDLATAIGMELFFDALGVCTLRDVPDPGTGQSVWTFSDSANPTIASATRSLTDQTVFNYIVAYGESVDNAVPVSAVAFDDNPNSPTYYLGAYGKVPTSFTSPQITTVEQAQAAADALLNLSIGNAENVELSVVPNPAIEPGDVITVSVGELKLSGTFLVNDVQIPLSAAEAMTLTVYRQSN
jgi:hypothetical protein